MSTTIMNKSCVKNQIIFNSYAEFLREVDLSDRVLMFMTYDFDMENLMINDLISKLKASNTRIHNFKVLDCSQTIKNISSIVNFMENNNVDTVIAIGEDFLAELLKAVNVFYNNKNISTLIELEANKKFLVYDKLKETIFIPTTGGGSEAHRFFRVIDDKFSQVTIFEDDMVKIDKIVLEPNLSKSSPLEYVMYYGFSVVSNLVDIILSDNVGSETKEVCRSILEELNSLLENGEKFGESLLFREKIINCSIRTSSILDKIGYGILYLYGILIESVFYIPRNTIDSLVIEFLCNEVMNNEYTESFKYYFDFPRINSTYGNFIKEQKRKYGAKKNLRFYNINTEIFEKLKRVSLNFLFKHGMIEKYKSLNFGENLNNKMFEYYLNGINFDLKMV